ncbi:hypothetical protein [Actinomadura coerulea]
MTALETYLEQVKTADAAAWLPGRRSTADLDASAKDVPGRP